MSSEEVPRRLDVALQAWRGITFRQWALTTVVALVLLLAYIIGVLPALMNAVPYIFGSLPTTGSMARFVGQTLVFLAAAYCFLLAVSIAEYGAGHGQPRVRRYVAASLAACGAAIVIEIVLFVFVPSLAWKTGGWTLLLDSRQLLGTIVFSAANFGLTGALALAVYVRFRSARLAREAFNAAELERVAASRDVLASRLAAMQARIEPGFLLGTLAQVEALHERDPQAGDRMLDSLIAYLHAALPQLRSQRSTLKAELQLAENYLRIVQIRMGSRLDFQVDVRPELDDFDFPPMVLLPLIDDALRNGLEPLPHGGTITVAADANGDRVRVRISDDGLQRTSASKDGPAITTLHERLGGLYGTTACLELIANSPQGVIAAIEVPLVDARNHR
jgi:sensor histidine kinase YesM